MKKFLWVAALLFTLFNPLYAEKKIAGNSLNINDVVDGEKNAKKEIVKDIQVINLKDYKELRARFKSRPIPVAGEFDKQKLQKYLDSLESKELKKAEYARIKQIYKIKEYVVLLMARNPYPNGVYLGKGKRSSRHSGIITMANDNILVVKRSKRSRRGRKYKWSKVAPIQYPLMLTYFAKMRLKMQGVSESTPEERKQQAAEEYLQAAVFCDWVGLYKNALKYGKKVIKLNPKSKDIVNSLLLD